MLNELFVQVVTLSLSAALIALLVAGLRLILKKAPKAWVCALWALVAVRLLIPSLPQSSVSMVPKQVIEGTVIRDISARPVEDTVKVHEYDPGFAEIVSREPMLPVQRESVRVDANADEAEKWQGAVPVGAAALNAEDTDKTEIVEVSFVEVSAATLQAPKTFGNTVLPVLSVIWLAGVCGMLLYMAFSYFRIWQKVQVSAREANNVFLSDNLTSPFILGVIRPRIYLPSGIRDDKKAYVLAHEQAHLKRLDHLWKPLGFLLLSVHWFNPVLWAAYILLCRDIELACDEKVIDREGEAFKIQYSEALLACSAKQRLVTACPLAFGEVGVKSRIRSVLNYRKPAFWILAGALLISLIAAGCALTNPRESTPPEKTDPASAAESSPAESTEALPSESTAANTDPPENSSDPGLPAESSSEPSQPESTTEAEVIASGLFRGISTDQEATLILTDGDEKQSIVFDSAWLKRVIASFEGWTVPDHKTFEYDFYLNYRGTDYTLRVNKSLQIEGMWRWRWGWGVCTWLSSGVTEYLGRVNGTLCWLPAAFVDVMEEWCLRQIGKQHFHDEDFVAFSWNNGGFQKESSVVPQTAENLPDTLGTARGKTEDIKGEHSYYIAALDLTLELPEGYYLYRIDGLYRDENWNPVRLEFVDEYILALRDLSEEELVEAICRQKEKPNVTDYVPDWVLWNFKIVHKDYLPVEQLYHSYIREVGEVRQAGDWLVISGTCPWWTGGGYYDEEGVFHKVSHEAAFSPEYRELYAEIVRSADEPDQDAFNEALRTRYDWPLLIDDENWHQEDLMETVLGACSGSGVGHYYYWRADGDHRVGNLIFAGGGKMTLYWDSYADASVLSDTWWNDYTLALWELQTHPEKYAYPGIAISFTDGGYPQTEETVKTKAWKDQMKEQARQREGWYQDASEEITARAFTYAWLRAVGEDVQLKDLAIYLKQSENDALLFLAFVMDPEKGYEMTPVFKGIDYLSLCDLEFARNYVEQYVK